jgi:hypothetical protein
MPIFGYILMFVLIVVVAVRFCEAFETNCESNYSHEDSSLWLCPGCNGVIQSDCKGCPFSNTCLDQ